MFSYVFHTENIYYRLAYSTSCFAYFFKNFCKMFMLMLFFPKGIQLSMTHSLLCHILKI